MKKFLLLALFATQIFAFSASKFVNDARSQIGVTLSYDPSYERLAYPMGDVDIKKGVCTDVVVRALRHQDMDLQRLIFEDMSRNFSVYPKKWGLKKADKFEGQTPLVIHNIGSGVQEENILYNYKITGHFRLK